LSSERRIETTVVELWQIGSILKYGVVERRPIFKRFGNLCGFWNFLSIVFGHNIINFNKFRANVKNGPSLDRFRSKDQEWSNFEQNRD